MALGSEGEAVTFPPAHPFSWAQAPSEPTMKTVQVNRKKIEKPELKSFRSNFFDQLASGPGDF